MIAAEARPAKRYSATPGGYTRATAAQVGTFGTGGLIIANNVRDSSVGAAVSRIATP